MLDLGATGDVHHRADRRVACGDRSGSVVQPALLADVRPDMRLSCDELFGPAVGVTRAANIDEAIALAMRSDPNVILMGEDVAGGGDRSQDGTEEMGGVLGTTRGLVGEFGMNRVRDTPIAEMGLIGTAVGAAATGLRPIAELMFMDFL